MHPTLPPQCPSASRTTRHRSVCQGSQVFGTLSSSVCPPRHSSFLGFESARLMIVSVVQPPHSPRMEQLNGKIDDGAFAVRVLWLHAIYDQRLPRAFHNDILPTRPNSSLGGFLHGFHSSSSTICGEALSKPPAHNSHSCRLVLPCLHIGSAVPSP